jgi:hypothetical protein
LFHDAPLCGWSSLLSAEGDCGVNGAVFDDESSELWKFECFNTFFSTGVVGISGSNTQIDIAIIMKISCIGISWVEHV